MFRDLFRRAFLPTVHIYTVVFCSLAQAEGAILTTPTQHEAAPPVEQPSISTSIPALAEFKKALLDLGLNFQLNYTGEVFGNARGGVKQRAIYDNLLELAIDADLNKIAGLNGASFIPCQLLSSQWCGSVDLLHFQLSDRQQHRGAAQHHGQCSRNEAGDPSDHYAAVGRMRRRNT